MKGFPNKNICGINPLQLYGLKIPENDDVSNVIENIAKFKGYVLGNL